MHAELAYLFRHALLREGAYQLQLPAERGRLHELALELLESLLGQDTTPFAAELAGHAALAAQSAPGARRTGLQRRELHYMQQAARHAKASYQNHAALGFYDRIVEHEQADATQRFDALFDGASVLRFAGRLAEAEGRYRRAGEVAGDSARKGRVQAELGEVLRERGQLEAALPHYHAALELLRAANDRANEAMTLAKIATCLHGANQLSEAEPLYEQALALHRASGNRLEEGIVLGNRAVLRMWQGRNAEAEAEFRQALQVQHETGNERFAAVTLGNFATLLRDMDRSEESRAMLEQAVARNRALGSRRPEAVFTANLAGAYLLQGDAARAEQMYRSALVLHGEIGSVMDSASAWADLGVALRAQERLKEARQCMRNAEEIQRAGNNRRGLCKTLRNIGEVHARGGDKVQARRALEEAVSIANELGNKEEAANAQKVLDGLE